MCGIAGVWSAGGPPDQDLLKKMSACLIHRGPDASGFWTDPSAGLGLAHTRLSILDLSAAGAQPMESHCGRFVIIYNGELYNFQELRRELAGQGVEFRGQSDTEVLLAAISLQGLEKALPGFNGMFAFALWDRGERRLHLARDRFGEKPLYYAWTAAGFLFGSELRALRCQRAASWMVDRDALALYLRWGYVPAPRTIYQGVFKLMPGSLLSLEVPGGPAPAPRPYWSLAEACAAGALHPIRSGPQEAAEELETLLRDAVRRRMISDVPLGAFLSGGVDSSLIVSLMQSISPRPVKTFTVALDEAGLNEGGFAAEVASRLGTEHTEVRATPREIMGVIPDLSSFHDEPFADSSEIPTVLISRLAKRSVTVSLSGDGGDELFGGYTRYQTAPALWRAIGWAPSALRRAASRLIKPLAPWSEPLRKASEFLPLDGPEALHLRLISVWDEPGSVVAGAAATAGQTDIPIPGGILDPVHRMMYRDTATYLTDDILTKVDRASMSVSLEVRVPFLDHRVCEYAWRLPVEWKARPGQGKWILRKILGRRLDPELFQRPKMGFGIPMGAWLRGPLREWGESLLGESRLLREGYLRPEPIRRLWEDNLSGRRDGHLPLWSVLMFQSWLDRWDG